MGVLIITIISAVMCYFNIISPGVFVAVVAASVVWMFVGSALYNRYGFLKFFYHDLLGWHRPDETTLGHDGCSACAVCKDCGEHILQDSQGNWF